MARMLLIAVALVAATLTGPAVAQTPPDAAELAAYRGLHAAAASGDVAAIRRLAGARRPVALLRHHTFGGQHGARQFLILELL